MPKIRPEELAVEIEAQLLAYSEEVSEQVKQDVMDVAKECVQEIKAKAPTKTGEYKRGWKVKKAYESPDDLRVVIYNSTKPQLAHLLEFGHAKVNGGRVEGIPHIYPAESSAEKKLVNKAKVAVKEK